MQQGGQEVHCTCAHSHLAKSALSPQEGLHEQGDHSVISVFAAPDSGTLQLMCSLGMEQGSEISSRELILHRGGKELGKRKYCFEVA